LAAAGRRVVLFERAPGAHDKVCGEFVSGAAQSHLDRHAGGARILPALGAVPIERVRLVCERLQASAALPFPAWGLSRRRLDAWLLAAAERQGVVVRRGCTVRALLPDGAGALLRTAEGDVRSEAAVLATGKHELHGHRRAGAASTHIGLKLHLRLAAARQAALERHVELVLFDGGYAGLQPIEDGLANLCLLVTRDRFARAGHDWRGLVATVPHLARRLAGATAARSRPLAIYRVPFGFLQRPDGNGTIYRVGDQAAVIASFTGDGMAMALRSAAEAAAAIAAGRPATSFQGALAESFAGPMRLASVVARAGTVRALHHPIVAACRLAPGLMAAVARRTRAA
jgi:flavin-dependent dehydrogenase